MKIVSRVLFGAVFLAALGWLGLYLSWHFKIVGAIQTLETRAVPAPPGSSLPYSVPEEQLAELRSAGCRALPYLVSSLEGSKNPVYLMVACDLIQKFVAPTDPSKPSSFPPEIAFVPDEAPEARQRKCQVIRDWWRLRGEEYHQSWRVWKDRCPRD